MPLVLAQKDDHWFLAAFAAHIQGCNLSTTLLPFDNRDRFAKHFSGVFVRSNAPLEGITFYPRLRFRGQIVVPWGWKPDTSEPILHVFMDSLEFPKVGDTGATIAQLERQGWGNVDPREGAFRYVHVDELEKTEGPPPEGPF